MFIRLRSAIVDSLDPVGLHISKSLDRNRLLSSFHRDQPKSSRNLPKWNIFIVLNGLSKAPFKPMKDSDLKHLTFKTAFLLTMASGKRCSEIHASVANKVSNLGQWEKVALSPRGEPQGSVHLEIVTNKPKPLKYSVEIGPLIMTFLYPEYDPDHSQNLIALLYYKKCIY